MKKFILSALFLSFSLQAKELIYLTWEQTSFEKSVMYIADSDELSDDFDGIKVKLANSSFDHTMSYAPKYLTFDYELERCPQTKSFENEIIFKNLREAVTIGRLKYWYTNKKCKLFVTLKTPFIDTKSIFFKN